MTAGKLCRQLHLRIGWFPKYFLHLEIRRAERNRNRGSGPLRKLGLRITL